jgi:hypothetical protein
MNDLVGRPDSTPQWQGMASVEAISYGQKVSLLIVDQFLVLRVIGFSCWIVWWHRQRTLACRLAALDEAISR